MVAYRIKYTVSELTNETAVNLFIFCLYFFYQYNDKKNNVYLIILFLLEYLLEDEEKEQIFVYFAIYVFLVLQENRSELVFQ